MMIRLYLLILIVASNAFAPSTACAQLLNSSAYSYRYSNIDGSGEKTVGPVPTPLMETEQTTTASLVFDVNAVPATYTELAAKAHVSIMADPEVVDIRDWLQVSAEANASINTRGTVQGVGEATSGQVVYNWILSGVTDIALTPILDDGGELEVRKLSALTILSASEPGGGLPFTELQTLPNVPTTTNAAFSEEYRIDPIVLAFTDVWSESSGGEVAINFDLSVSLEGEFENIDAEAYDVAFGADFANTAKLKGVRILDVSGNEISGATLITEDGFTFPGLSNPDPVSVTIDVRDAINLKSQGVLSVDVASTSEFDVADVNIASLLLGDPHLAEAGGERVSPIASAFEDLTGNGLTDHLTLKFGIPDMIESGVLGPLTTELTLTGSTIDGVDILVSDTVRIVGAQTVPEPHSSLLLFLAVMGVHVCRRKSKGDAGMERSSHTPGENPSGEVVHYHLFTL